MNKPIDIQPFICEVSECPDVQRLKKALEDVRDVCNCSIEPMNCGKCPFNDNCEELCVNDENLQNIIINEISEVLKYE